MKSDKSMLTITGRTLRRVLRNTRGATAIEYGLILAFVVIALIVGLTNLADSTIGMWGKVETKVATAR
ncbi:Flp family type IVb pilin [Sphingomonas sp. LB2R24]|uniref:Flp family type IVb pilin n=1 Tax=Sphingomonas sorbitolis TaxID=3096165 RepID=UPI002FCBF2B2